MKRKTKYLQNGHTKTEQYLEAMETKNDDPGKRRWRHKSSVMKKLINSNPTMLLYCHWTFYPS